MSLFEDEKVVFDETKKYKPEQLVLLADMYLDAPAVQTYYPTLGYDVKECKENGFLSYGSVCFDLQEDEVLGIARKRLKRNDGVIYDQIYAVLKED